ncbi:thioredoxin-disulfide reductase [Rhodococcus sp. NPDC127530]|uniref:thioredoxin-disulfide reductase n=1 Tax=unclassified Rhodococcus (in: high G+C Gram-positive bacteria) TaxID=192944 RepID=UPI003637313E
MNSPRNVIIIGGGPAGYTAAIYTARANLNPLVFEGTQYGGALMQTTDVENFPGFVEGIQGPELMDTLRKQAERYGSDLLAKDVTSVDLTNTVKRVTVDGEHYDAKTVILAMGSAYRTLGMPNEKRLSGHGVSWCATCDGFFFRDQHIAVIGGGDSALEEAMFLTRFAASVTVVHRRDTLKASKIMQERAFANSKIRFLWNSVAEDVIGDEQVVGLVVRDTATDHLTTLRVTGVFIAIGHDPRNDLVHGQVELDDAGYVLTEGRTSRTPVSGVFACGDLVDHTYRQAITAAGSGCSAALDVERYLAADGSH